jgi:hypothetical protein
VCEVQREREAGRLCLVGREDPSKTLFQEEQAVAQTRYRAKLGLAGEGS